MTTTHKLNLIATAFVGALAFTTAQAEQALQVPIPITSAEVSGLCPAPR